MDHARHMTIPFSRASGVSQAPRDADMQVLGPITGGRRSSDGGVHLLLPPLDALVCVSSCDVLVIGSWLGAGHGAGVPGCRASSGGMCRRSSVRMSRSKRRTDILGRLVSTASSLTLMHQVLRSRVGRRRKCIGGIS